MDVGDVDVVLPCLDEAAALPAVLAAMPPGFRPIVVDGGSRDGSPRVAVAHGATLMYARHGSAVGTGLAGATAPVVCVMACDGSLDPGELPRLVAPLLAGEADLVTARRVPGDARGGGRAAAEARRVT
ncbi:MAG TPA: glycosyltransferase, partial [Pseudonocardiaceae bacterium]